MRRSHILTRSCACAPHPACSQKGLPLTIMGIHATSPAFADAEPFPPPPVAAGAPPPAGSADLDFYLIFESSGKWPDDLEAISHLQTAFYLRLASLLEEQASMLCEVRERNLCVQCEGFTFRGVVLHEPSLRLLEKQGEHAAAAALRWQTSAGAMHTSAISALGRAHPALGPTLRLAKRWLACQLHTADVPSALVELLACRPFATPGERPPASAVCGFAHFLHTLASFDFEAASFARFASAFLAAPPLGWRSRSSPSSSGRNAGAAGCRAAFSAARSASLRSRAAPAFARGTRSERARAVAQRPDWEGSTRPSVVRIEKSSMSSSSPAPTPSSSSLDSVMISADMAAGGCALATCPLSPRSLPRGRSVRRGLDPFRQPRRVHDSRRGAGPWTVFVARPILCWMYRPYSTGSRGSICRTIVKHAITLARTRARAPPPASQSSRIEPGASIHTQLSQQSA